MAIEPATTTNLSPFQYRGPFQDGLATTARGWEGPGWEGPCWEGDERMIALDARSAREQILALGRPLYAVSAGRRRGTDQPGGAPSQSEAGQ